MSVYVEPRDIPVKKRFPCRGCRFLGPVYHGAELSEHYMRCSYMITAPVPYWNNPNAVGEVARWRNIKYMDGPHEPDAENVVCDVREPAE